MTDTETPRRAQVKEKRRRPRAPLVVGVILLALGVGALSWFAWEFWGTNIPAVEAQKAEKQKLREVWSTPSASSTPIPGDGIAILRIPDFGSDWEQPVLVGTDQDTLMRGLGWYENTAMPGEIGNFAVAGHRSGHGRPFDQLLDLKAGSQVIVETRTYIYTYELDNSPADLTVKNTDTWVLDSVPGKPDEKPTKALITLTTCQDFFSSPDRSIGFGHLVSSQKK
ncbi:class E sortase [Propionicicella superfundia]|uniref:class E sortase n=1 Tax=Propionicicella superfundia TaxID=348582 RepID=UPI001FE1642B|nr:class E sortase [Propionicicella superfundia]